MKSILRSSLSMAAAIALGAGLTAGGLSLFSGHSNGHGGGKEESVTAAEIYQDGIRDYGVCRGLDDDCYNDWGNGWEKGEDKRILVWSRTAGPRHEHLGTPLGEGLNPELGDDNVAQAALVEWGAERGIAVDYTEDLAAFKGLSAYQAVVFLSPTRDTLDDAAQTELQKYVRAGGGFVGIHNAFGAEYHWDWYEGLLGGTNFFDHGPNREGTISVVDRHDTSTKFMKAKTWSFTDEFYNLYPRPTYVNVLLEATRSTSAPGSSGHPGMGRDYPLSWCHYYDGGRAWLTTLGHSPELWADPGSVENGEVFQKHVMNGIESAMGASRFCSAR